MLRVAGNKNGPGFEKTSHRSFFPGHGSFFPGHGSFFPGHGSDSILFQTPKQCPEVLAQSTAE